MSDLVTTAAGARELARSLAGAGEVALDTEFHGERSYSPRLMLLQLASRDHIALVDPLGPADVGALIAALRDAGTLVVGHAIRHDLLVLHRTLGALPARVFDTQIAAAFLGYGESIGLARLVEAELGVHLEKGSTMADWSKRPLAPPLLAYAAGDVEHLLPLADRLRARLREAGRAAWVEEECRLLVDPARYELPAPADAWLRVKGRRPTGRDAVVLRELATERDLIARKIDASPSYVLPDELLLDLAARKPKSEREVAAATHRRKSPGLEQHAARWVAAVRRGVAAPLPPAEPHAAPPTPGAEALAALAKLLVRHLAEGAGIAPALLRVDEALAELVAAPPAAPDDFARRLGLSGWREELVGEPLRALFEGRLHLGAAPVGDYRELAVVRRS